MARVLISGPIDCLPFLFINDRCNCGNRISCVVPYTPIDRITGLNLRNTDPWNRISGRRKGSVEIEALSGTQCKVQMGERNGASVDITPDHLLVLVHGIMASPSDWKYVEAELKRRLGNRFLIYASAANSYTQTLHGIDVAGRRLAEEVHQVIRKTPSLKRISFLAHSLGGLFARYAIAVLYRENSDTHVQSSEQDSKVEMLDNKSMAELKDQYTKVPKATIAGLEAINFVTLATPHLGVRGKNQLPFLLGVPLLEKIAPPLAQSRILYANVSYDHMVGWRTSSIRREAELVKPPEHSLDGYKHVVDVVYCPPVLTDGPSYGPETAKAKEAAQTTPSSRRAEDYYDKLEEEMIRGLQRVGWKKVDVSFHSALWPFFAHNNIHVKQEWLHYAGAGVVAHVADSLKQQEIMTFIPASL